MGGEAHSSRHLEGATQFANCEAPARVVSLQKGARAAKRPLCNEHVGISKGGERADLRRVVLRADEARGLQPPLAEKGQNFFFGGVDNVKWRKPLVPGDVLVC